MLVGTTAVVLILALFLAVAGWVGIVVGRALRDGADLREAAGNVLLLAIIFAAGALVAVEYAAAPLDALLGHLGGR